MRPSRLKLTENLRCLPGKEPLEMIGVWEEDRASLVNLMEPRPKYYDAD